MQNTNNQPFFGNSVQQSPPNEVETSQSLNVNINQSQSVSHQQQLQQQQYAAYIQQQQHQRYYAQQQYLMQQRQQQYAYYVQSVRQCQQHQYTHYHQQIAQQYEYPAMVNHNINQNINHNYNYDHNPNINRNGGPIILSSEEQPSLIASDTDPKYKRRRRRKKRKLSEIENDETSNEPTNGNETVSIDIQDDDDDVLGLDKDGYNKHTLINQNECVPDINTQFAEWLYFTKKLWQRQRKYKNLVILHDDKENETNKLDLTDSVNTAAACELNLDSSPCGTLRIKSAFLKDRARMKVSKNKPVINIMIKMGLAPPWNEMSKYKKWIKWNQANDADK